MAWAATNEDDKGPLPDDDATATASAAAVKVAAVARRLTPPRGRLRRFVRGALVCEAVIISFGWGKCSCCRSGGGLLWALLHFRLTWRGGDSMFDGC